MPYKTGSDIGGFGRLAESQRWVAGQERLDVKEEQTTKLFNLQMEANQLNIGEVKRGKAFKQQYMQALSTSAPGEHYQTGQDFLAKYAEESPDNADIAYTAMQELDAKWSDVIDTVSKKNPKAGLTLFNKTIGEKMGVFAEDAGTDLEWGDLKEMFNAETGESLGIFRLDEKTGKPVYHAKGSLKQPKAGISEIEAEAMTQDQIDYFGALYNLNGKIPSLGRGKASTKVRVEIAKSAARQALEDGTAGAAAGTVGVQADVKALSSSITQQTKQYGAMGSFVRNLSMQVDRVEEISKKFKTADPRFLNIPIRALRGKIVGSADQAIYDMYLTEIEGEIGKLATGSTGSVAELSATAQEKWAKIHDKNLSISDMLLLLEETKHAGDIRMKSVSDNLVATRDQLRLLGGDAEQTTKHPDDIMAILAKHGAK